MATFVQERVACTAMRPARAPMEQPRGRQAVLEKRQACASCAAAYRAWRRTFQAALAPPTLQLHGNAPLRSAAGGQRQAPSSTLGPSRPSRHVGADRSRRSPRANAPVRHRGRAAVRACEHERSRKFCRQSSSRASQRTRGPSRLQVRASDPRGGEREARAVLWAHWTHGQAELQAANGASLQPTSRNKRALHHVYGAQHAHLRAACARKLARSRRGGGGPRARRAHALVRRPRAVASRDHTLSAFLFSMWLARRHALPLGWHMRRMSRRKPASRVITWGAHPGSRRGARFMR